MNRYDRNLQVCYVGILMSTLICAVIVWTTANAGAGTATLSEELRDPLTIGLYATAAAAFLAAMFTRPRRLLVVRWAMLDVTCILGLIVALLFGDWRLFAAPWTLALAGLVALYPRVRTAPR